MKKINVALIGAGQTMEQHIRAIKLIKNYNIKLQGIYSRTLQKAENLKKKWQ